MPDDGPFAHSALIDIYPPDKVAPMSWLSLGGLFSPNKTDEFLPHVLAHGKLKTKLRAALRLSWCDPAAIAVIEEEMQYHEDCIIALGGTLQMAIRSPYITSFRRTLMDAAQLRANAYTAKRGK